LLTYFSLFYFADRGHFHLLFTPLHDATLMVSCRQFSIFLRRRDIFISPPTALPNTPDAITVSGYAMRCREACRFAAPSAAIAARFR